MIRPYVVDASQPAESVDHRVGDQGEALGVRMGQYGLDRIAQGEDLPAEGDAAHVRRHAHFLPPRLHDFSGGNPSLLRSEEFEFDGGDIGLRIEGGLRVESALDSRSQSHGHRDTRQQWWRVFRPVARESFDDPAARSLQLPRHFVRSPSGGPVGHLQHGRREITLNIVGQRGGDDSRRHQGDAQHQHSDGPRHRHPGPGRGKPQGPVQGPLHEPLQPEIDTALESRKEPVEGIAWHPFRTGQVGQVVGQDKERLHQRNQQHGDHYDRQGPPYVTDAARDEQQRDEGNRRSQDRERQRHLDPPDAAYRGRDTVGSATAFALNALAYHYGVVNDDPDGEDKGEEADGVDRHVECHHDSEGAQARNGEAHGNPQGKPHLKKQAEGDQHQQQT